MLRSTPRFVLDDPCPAGQRRPHDTLVLSADAGALLAQHGAPVRLGAHGFKDGYTAPRYVAVVYDAWMDAGDAPRARLLLSVLFVRMGQEPDLAAALCAVHGACGARATVLLMLAWCGAQEAATKRARRRA